MICGAELRVHFLKSFQKRSTCENLSQKRLKTKKDGSAETCSSCQIHRRDAKPPYSLWKAQTKRPNKFAVYRVPVNRRNKSSNQLACHNNHMVTDNLFGLPVAHV
jgi:hypothetical protein